MTNWIEPDYDRLFRGHPPTEPAAPRGDELQTQRRNAPCAWKPVMLLGEP